MKTTKTDQKRKKKKNHKEVEKERQIKHYQKLQAITKMT